MRLNDRRISLEANTELLVSNREKGKVCYFISEEIGRGSSCIVYDGYYYNNAGSRRKVRIKECYPLSLQLNRGQDQKIICRDETAFQSEKEQFRQGFLLNTVFSENEELTNTAVNTIDIYETNGTVYIVTSYVEGKRLSFEEDRSLKSVLTIAKTIARAVARIHEQGYLYLDMKPANVFLFKETDEMVQLFDFDSPVSRAELIQWSEEAADRSVDGTEGFAPLELRQGLLRHMGPWTDVYELGALVFYLLFGRTPSAPDCDPDAMYSFEESIVDLEKYSDQWAVLMTSFFHRTLATFFMDRYQNMNETILMLDRMLQEADPERIFLHSSKIPAPGLLVGRRKELNRLSAWWEKKEDPIFYITGMGGIGKSTLVRQFVTEHKQSVDYCLYLSLQGESCSSITDDLTVAVNGVTKLQEESDQDYFERKLQALKRIGLEGNSLLILDNFAGELTENQQMLLDLGWKTLLISRESRYQEFFPTMEIGPLSGISEYLEVFEESLGRSLTEGEEDDFSAICSMVQGHTLILELLGRQIRESLLTLKEARELVKAQGFSGISEEKIDFARDQHFQYDTVRGIIRSLFDRQYLSIEEHGILKNMTLFYQSGLSMSILQEALKMTDDKPFRTLEAEGWIRIQEECLSMHPLIYEVTSFWQWQQEEKLVAESVMNRVRERIIDKGSDPRERRSWLYATEQILDTAVRTDDFETSYSFHRLMAEAVGEMPPDREEIILKFGERLLSGWRKNAKAFSTRQWLKICDMVNTVYLNREEYDASMLLLKRAKKIAGRKPENQAFYYSMEGQYYDYRLNGEYDDACGNPYLKDLMGAQKKTIHYWKISKAEEAKRELIGSLTELVIILIRSVPEEKKKIQDLLKELKVRMAELTEKNTQAEYAYHMALAWYYTYVDCQPARMDICVKKGKKIAEHIYLSDLDQIDYVWIPYANMKLECKGADPEQTEKAAEVLKIAARLCDKYPDIDVYRRKREELLEHIEDIRGMEGEESIN